MRLAIISDIHGNLEALTKALELIGRMGVDETVCLGDVVGYGANPNECVDLVRQKCSFILRGNHDAAAVDLSVAETFTMNARLSAVWTNKNLGKENKDFLVSLPFTQEKERSLYVHATPCNPPEWEYILTEYDAKSSFRCFEQAVCFIGHTHTPVIFDENGKTKTIRRDIRCIVNVGSVGQPRDGNPKLSFGVFDSTRWEYENVRSAYDITNASQKIADAGLPRGLAERLWVGV
ncbi:MAG: metallophosphoesterase family protein [Ignavibacteriales bacterium]|nr:metallophosphoesterase family protein [Ignavibacteriales bacterium]